MGWASAASPHHLASPHLRGEPLPLSLSLSLSLEPRASLARALKLVEPDARRHGQLSSTLIPKLVEETQEASDQLMKIKIDFEAAELEFKSAQESLDSSKALLHEVITPWSQMLKQIEEQTAALGDRTETDTSAAAAKTIDGIDGELNQAEADRVAAQTARDKAASDLSALQEKISRSRDTIHVLQEKIRQIGDGQQTKIALETKIASLVEDSESAATDAAEKSAELKKFDQEKKKLATQKQKVRVCVLEWGERSEPGPT